MTIKSNTWFILISFSIVFGWIMSFPYEGPVMYALAGEQGLNVVLLNTFTVFSHFLGLFCGRFINKSPEQSKRNIMVSVIVMLFISLFIPAISVKLWLVVIPLISFVAGIPITSYARLINSLVPVDERIKMGAKFDIIVTPVAGNADYAYQYIYHYEWRITSPNKTQTTAYFSDLPQSHWSFDYVQHMVDLGIIQGYDDGTFRPDVVFSRAAFAKLLALTFELDSYTGSEAKYYDLSTSH